MFTPLTDDSIAQNENLVVIDKDSGTVLGTNVVLVYVASGSMDDVLDSDSTAIEYAERHGRVLHVEQVCNGDCEITDENLKPNAEHRFGCPVWKALGVGL
jgi:hypothetical protein